jgi:hypothetical protein
LDSRDPFLTTFGPYFCPCFPALGNPTMLPAVQKIVGRYFAHREQECPSAKGSFPRKVNKTRKTGFYGPRMLSLEPVKPTSPAITPNSLPDPATHVTNTSPSPLFIHSARDPSELTLAPALLNHTAHRPCLVTYQSLLSHTHYWIS